MNLRVYKKYNELPSIIKKRGNISVFGSQEYADYIFKSKQYTTVWFKGEFEDSKRSYIIPFATKSKFFFTKGMFLDSPLLINSEGNIDSEKAFLNNLIDYIKEHKMCDWIQQGPNWAIFKCVPDNSIYAPFGSYVIDLKAKTTENHYKSLYTKVRGRINQIKRKGNIVIKKNEQCIEDAVEIINYTLSNALIENFTMEKFKLMKRYLKNNITVYTSYFNNIPQSSYIYFHNSYAAYGIYSGSKNNAVQGSTDYIVWNAIDEFKQKGVRFYDCVGARINPDKNSKLFRIQRNKSHFGTELVTGFLWKTIINKRKYLLFKLYIFMTKLFNGKKKNVDIIDQERKRLGIL